VASCRDAGVCYPAALADRSSQTLRDFYGSVILTEALPTEGDIATSLKQA
jgi:hypothetical protein